MTGSITSSIGSLRKRLASYGQYEKRDLTKLLVDQAHLYDITTPGVPACTRRRPIVDLPVRYTAPVG